MNSLSRGLPLTLDQAHLVTRPSLVAEFGRAIADVGLPFSAGALLALSFVPGFSIVAWIALVPFAAALCRPRGTIELYVGAYLGGIVLHLHGLSFLRMKLSSTGVFDSNLLDWLATSLFWAMVWPATLYVGRRALRGYRVRMVVGLPLLWLASEFFRQELGGLLVARPFPWLQVGLTQVTHLRLLQVADLGGVWAIAAVVAMVNGAIYDAIAIRRLWPLLAALAFVAVSAAYGEFRLRETATDAGPHVAIMSASKRPTHSRLQVGGATLAVWPETVPGLTVNDPHSQTVHALETAARSCDSAMIVGCVRAQDGTRYNSAAVIDPIAGCVGYYDKQFLVPWSEYTPWNRFLDRSKQGTFSKGSNAPVFQLGTHSCGVLICYDAAFDRLFRRFSTRPDFFVACSRESSDPTGFVSRMLLTMTRLRAVENRRAIVRSVEDGYSGIVSSTGRFIQAPDASPMLGCPILIDHRETFFAYAGNWLPLTCCFIVALAILRTCVSRRSHIDVSMDRRIR